MLTENQIYIHCVHVNSRCHVSQNDFKSNSPKSTKTRQIKIQIQIYANAYANINRNIFKYKYVINIQIKIYTSKYITNIDTIILILILRLI